MSTPSVALLPGDGIGPEVLTKALQVLSAVGFRANYIEADIGWKCWCQEGDALPSRTIETLRGARCALFGAITSKPADDAARELAPHLRGTGLIYQSPIVRLRQMFDLYANVRPCRSYVGCPGLVHNDMDMVIFRENTQGLYVGLECCPVPERLFAALTDSVPGSVHRIRTIVDGGADNAAISVRLLTRRACARIITAAFRYAQSTSRASVTLIDKPNVLSATGGLITRVFREIAPQYPDVQAREALVDSACMHMVTDARRFDVIVAENMFGDILSDLAAGLTGGLGVAPSANIGDSFAIFEPVHGSAPDIAGTGVANPIAAILSAAMMLDWLGEHQRSTRIRLAVASVIQHDLAACAQSTQRITDNILRTIAAQA